METGQKLQGRMDESVGGAEGQTELKKARQLRAFRRSWVVPVGPRIYLRPEERAGGI